MTSRLEPLRIAATYCSANFAIASSLLLGYCASTRVRAACSSGLLATAPYLHGSGVVAAVGVVAVDVEQPV